VPTLLIHDLPGVDRIGATTGGLPLQRMKQPCLFKGNHGGIAPTENETALPFQGGLGGILGDR